MRRRKPTPVPQGMIDWRVFATLAHEDKLLLIDAVIALDLPRSTT